MKIARSHSQNPTGISRLLRDHLRTVAQETQNKLPEKAHKLAYYAGLWHDLGKYNPAWQQRLEEVAGDRSQRIGIPHSYQGAVWAARYCQILAFPIFGHHSGMPDLSDLKKVKEAEHQNNCDLAINQTLQDFPNGLEPDQDLSALVPKSPLEVDLLLRIIFSALVDADHTDAAKHFGNWEDNQFSTITDLYEQLQTNQKEFIESTVDTPINQVRKEIYDFCSLDGKLSPGFYSLTAPTGGGKTRSLMNFGLTHCLSHNKRMVIYTAPFNIILEQTAQIYRDIFGNDAVLEHHSNFDLDQLEEDDEALNRYRLAGLRWEHPIIVTTPNQLFESLFSNRPSKCRKLHHIINSVIVLDEAHKLPIAYLDPIMDILKALVKDWDCTLLFCSASFNPKAWMKQIFEIDCKEIIPDEALKRHFHVMKRVKYRYINDCHWNWEDVVQDIRSQNVQSALIVVNTTADARNGFIELEQRLNPEHCFHLSTRMYPLHRKRVINEIRQRLDSKQPTYLIATQLIEAGVDLDFAAGYRVLGPLDSIVQAAGRVNRSGNYSQATLTIFQLAGGNLPGKDYRKKVDLAKQELQQEKDLTRSDSLNRYFCKLLQDNNKDCKEIQSMREKLMFASVANKFQLIDEAGKVDVVVETEEALRILNKSHLNQRDYQQLQQYTVRLPEKVAAKAKENNDILVWNALSYDGRFGIPD